MTYAQIGKLMGGVTVPAAADAMRTVKLSAALRRSAERLGRQLANT